MEISRFRAVSADTISSLRRLELRCVASQLSVQNKRASVWFVASSGYIFKRK